MDGISSVARVVAVIQAQLAQKSGRLDGARKKAAPAALPRDDLGRSVAARIAAIAADDPQRGRKAFRIFLDAVLLSELGAGLASDPAFHQLVADVHSALENDPALAPLVAQASALLLNPAAGGYLKDV